VDHIFDHPLEAIFTGEYTFGDKLAEEGERWPFPEAMHVSKS
jgi:hypothetical protein